MGIPGFRYILKRYSKAITTVPPWTRMFADYLYIDASGSITAGEANVLSNPILEHLKASKAVLIASDGLRPKAKTWYHNIPKSRDNVPRISGSLDYFYKLLPINHKVTQLISGNDIPGEAEQKILAHLRARIHSGVLLGSSLVIGQDTDLILVCIASGMPDLFAFISPHHLSGGSLFSFNEFMKLLQADFHEANTMELHRIRLDFILTMLLHGSDYLPKITRYMLDQKYFWDNYLKHRRPGEFLWNHETKSINRELLAHVLFPGVKKTYGEPGTDIGKDVENYMNGLRWTMNMFTTGGILDTFEQFEGDSFHVKSLAQYLLNTATENTDVKDFPGNCTRSMDFPLTMYRLEDLTKARKPLHPSESIDLYTQSSGDLYRTFENIRNYTPKASKTTADLVCITC